MENRLNATRPLRTKKRMKDKKKRIQDKKTGSGIRTEKTYSGQKNGIRTKKGATTEKMWLGQKKRG